MNVLCIDIGNTRTKTGFFENDELSHTEEYDFFTEKDALDLFNKYKNAAVILSSTAKTAEIIYTIFSEAKHFILLNHETRVPFINRYATPETLGRDRIAVAAAATYMYPNENVLIIDAGTCITMDMVTADGQYLGGSIHPGVQMRLKAMHNYTGKLPLIEKQKFDNTMGDSTLTCLLAGGVRASAMEMDAFITDYRERFPGCKVALTGGDADLFVSMLKNEIFALPNLVLTGLYKIALYNVNI